MAESRTYSVVVEPLEEGGFLVHVPAFQEIVTGGDTEDEALEMARDAIELVLASRTERGEDVPKEIGKARVRELTVSLAADGAGPGYHYGTAHKGA